MHAFTDGASKSLVMEYLLTLKKKKQQNQNNNKNWHFCLFFFLFHQMQPVDLLGITIKTLAEIEKEVGSHQCTKKCREICVNLVVRFSPCGKGLVFSKSLLVGEVNAESNSKYRIRDICDLCQVKKC